MTTFSQFPLCRTFAALVFLSAFALAVQAQPQPQPITPEKAMMMGYVEHFFMTNARDITMRKSLEWGDVQTDDDGNRTIRYKFEALIWDKDRVVFCFDLTFNKDGDMVNLNRIEGYPKPVEKPDVTTLEGVQKLVERFFSQNFFDITARTTIQWGELEKHEDGKVSLVYRYQSVIRDENIFLDERRFTFDKDGNVVSFARTEGFPQEAGKVARDVSSLEAVKKLVERFFTQNYMDITARRAIRWGELEKHDDGSVSLVYRYEATIRGGDKIVQEQRFTFDKNGTFVKVEKIESETNGE
jgi:hypothetical protein